MNDIRTTPISSHVNSRLGQQLLYLSYANVAAAGPGMAEILSLIHI